MEDGIGPCSLVDVPCAIRMCRGQGRWGPSAPDLRGPSSMRTATGGVSARCTRPSGPVPAASAGPLGPAPFTTAGSYRKCQDRSEPDKGEGRTQGKFSEEKGARRRDSITRASSVHKSPQNQLPTSMSPWMK